MTDNLQEENNASQADSLRNNSLGINSVRSNSLGVDPLRSDLLRVDSLRIKGFDYIELYVGNVPQAAHYYGTTFGFTPIAYAGLETGLRDRVSLVLEQRNIRLMLTGALEPD